MWLWYHHHHHRWALFNPEHGGGPEQQGRTWSRWHFQRTAAMRLWLLPPGLSMLGAKSPSVCSLPREPGVGARYRHPALALGLGHMSLFLGSAQTGGPTIARISPIGPTHALAKCRPWFGLSQPWSWSSTLGVQVDVRGPDTVVARELWSPCWLACPRPHALNPRAHHLLARHHGFHGSVRPSSRTPPLHRRGNCGSETLSLVPKVSQAGHSWAQNPGF